MTQTSRTKLLVIGGLFVAVGVVGGIVGLVIANSSSNNNSDGGNNAEQSSGSSTGNIDINSVTTPPTTTVLPSALPSAVPSAEPSSYPSGTPSSFPSSQPSDSAKPSTSPSSEPTQSLLPSSSLAPSSFPSVQPSQSAAPTEWQETVIYAIADVPYNDRENLAFPGYVQSIPADADFAIHLGDIKNAQSDCSQGRFQNVANVLKNSKPPMFIVVGDNEWNDCANPDAALTSWRNVFAKFDEQDPWKNRNLGVTRGPRPETFTFVLKKTLFVGVNVPGSLKRCCDWNNMLTEQGNWARDVMRRHTNGDAAYEQVNGIVLMGHANPTGAHRWFFDPITNFIANDLALPPRNLPVLYLCADSHTWLYEPNYQGRPNYLRIRVTGGVGEPPLKLVINPTAYRDDPGLAFRYERFWKQ